MKHNFGINHWNVDCQNVSVSSQIRNVVCNEIDSYGGWQSQLLFETWMALPGEKNICFCPVVLGCYFELSWRTWITLELPLEWNFIWQTGRDKNQACWSHANWCLSAPYWFYLLKLKHQRILNSPGRNWFSNEPHPTAHSHTSTQSSPNIWEATYHAIFNVMKFSRVCGFVTL